MAPLPPRRAPQPRVSALAAAQTLVAQEAKVKRGMLWVASGREREGRECDEDVRVDMLPRGGVRRDEGEVLLLLLLLLPVLLGISKGARRVQEAMSCTWARHRHSRQCSVAVARAGR